MHLAQTPEVMPLDRLLREWRPGSQGDEWTWVDEYEHLWFDPDQVDRTAEVARSVLADGMLEPVLLGDDGRVWDGHHRIVVAMRYDFGAVPFVYPATADYDPERSRAIS